jgi:D-alanyl-D-alanine dipeptidase
MRFGRSLPTAALLIAGAAWIAIAPLPAQSPAAGNPASAASVENQQEQVFQITPLKSVAELRREALAAKTPAEAGPFLPPDLVDVTKFDPTIKLYIRYATSRNFLGTPVYSEARAFLQRPAAEALARASAKLRPLGYELLIHDAYRPWYVTKIFWDATPDDKKQFVANPAEGSRHNRGCAVDLTLYDLKTGDTVTMPGGYDERSKRSYASYAGGTAIERSHRELLRNAMESEGFKVYPLEWWHFDFRDWQRYPILNLTFEQMDNSPSIKPHS